MCLICVEYQMNRMTRNEAKRMLGEMSSRLSDEHILEIEEMIKEEEIIINKKPSDEIELEDAGYYFVNDCDTDFL